jgi:hypothetical protein
VFVWNPTAGAKTRPWDPNSYFAALTGVTLTDAAPQALTGFGKSLISSSASWIFSSGYS